MPQKPSRAVAEARAPKEVEADDKTRARWRELDWFATPPFASRAGGEIIKAIDPHAESAWECACGDGIMAACLKPYFRRVWASDIEPQVTGARQIDFRLEGPDMPEADWIITNPPFALAEDFVRIGLRRARRGVAVLCRLAFLESVGRYPLHFGGEHPLTILAPFSERVAMQLGPWEPDCSTATAYAWFIYRRAGANAPGPAIIRPIGPGTKARLSEKGDVARFVRSDTPPLFDQL